MLTSLVILLSSLRMIVIPVQFQDREFTTDSTSMSSKVEAAQAYFERQFRQTLNISFELVPIVTLSHETAYYGCNYPERKDVLLYEAVKEACRLSSESIDFSRFDGDNDGKVDNVILLYAGPSEDDGAGSDFINQQHAHLSDYYTSLVMNGKSIDSFSACCELHTDNGDKPRDAGIGVFCHEVAHALGLPDLYDNDGDASGGKTSGLKGESLMDSGCTRDDWHNPPALGAIEHHILGTGICEELALGETVLDDISQSGRYIKAESDKLGEYYLFACHSAKLYIYHIDNSDNSAAHSDYYGRKLTASERWKYNQINCNPEHPCAELVAMLPDDHQHAFGSDTAIPYKYWSGHCSTLALSDIRSSADGSISFNVIDPIQIEGITVYQDAATIKWATHESLNDIQDFELEVIGASDTTHYQISKDLRCYTIEHLEPYTEHLLTVRAHISESESYSVKSYFVTKVYRKDTHPYILLSDVPRGKDGSFLRGTEIPLRVFNAGKVDNVCWYFNDSLIPLTPQGTFVLSTPGILKAELQYPDGSTEIIIKRIEL